MSRTMKKRSAKAGLPPGALVYVGDPRTKTSRITVMDYTADTVRETTVQDPSQCGQFESADSVTWMNIDELSEPGIVAGLGASLHFHPLMQEDILNTDQRTKLEDHGDHLYIVLKMLDWDAQRDAMDVEQLSLVLGANYVLSFQERAGDFFDPLRNRIRQNAGRVRKLGPDYLAYCLLDLTLDHYFIVLEKLGERIERVEDAVMTRPRRETLSEIHALKRELVYMRKAVWPVKEVIASLRHLKSPLMTSGMQPFLRDLQDHIEQVIEGVATYQTLLADTLSTYLSTQSNRTNTIMKVLAVFSAVFMPLTFVTGIFGMNFRNMPPLEWEWGFHGTVAGMLVMGGLLAAYFVRKRWV